MPSYVVVLTYVQWSRLAGKPILSLNVALLGETNHGSCPLSPAPGGTLPAAFGILLRWPSCRSAALSGRRFPSKSPEGRVRPPAGAIHFGLLTALTEPVTNFLAGTRRRGKALCWRSQGNTKQWPPLSRTEVAMFFFFSNGLGIVGSIVVSVVVTLLLLKACAM